MKLLFSTLFIANVAVCLSLYYLIPSLQPLLKKEDMLVENLTAFFFLAASLLSLFYLLKKRSKFLQKLCLFISVLGLVAFLDEVSFGERAFKLSMPLVGSQKVDAVHDLFKLSFTITSNAIKKIPTPYLGLFLLVLGSVGLYIVNKHKERLLNISSNISSSQPYFFFRVAICLLFVATIIDFGIVHNETLFLLEELFEMNAGLALVFCVLNVFMHRSQRHKTIHIPANKFILQKKTAVLETNEVNNLS